MVLVTDIYSDSIDDNAVAVVSYMTMHDITFDRKVKIYSDVLF